MPRSSYIAAAFTKLVTELDIEKDINVTLQETNSLHTITNVSAGKFNLGIIRYKTVYENYFFDYLSNKKLCHDQIWEFEYLALMSSHHPLAQVPKVTIDTLSSFIEIIHGDTAVPYLDTGAGGHSSEQPISQKRIYLYDRCNQFDILCNIPTTYMWVSPVPDEPLKRYDLVQRKCLFINNKYKDALIYPQGYTFTSLDKKFIDKIFESKNMVSLKQYS
jgi:hypothetical protein